MALLEVRDLTKTFRAGRRAPVRTAVDDVSFDLEAGRTLALVGESGAGKSTIGRLVLRLVEPDAGSVRMGGEDLLALSPQALRAFRTRAQMVFQDPFSALDPRTTIGTSVAEPLIVHGIGDRAERRDRVVDLLERVGIGSHLLGRFPAQLSGGQLQRVSIARALTTDPELIVCDEAVSALDVSIQAQVLELLADLQAERGLAYLFITHDLAVVEAFAHDVVVLRAGAVVERGPVGELFANPAEDYTRELLDAVPYLPAL
ncbi:ATP-binding cassette domain-containing protein [Pseudonocardia pini]|uniref:ATP-binding cassette domain-containing protein n=1 Tax=Pseudonocardia pini TaxID=2758030 RepID=UPI0015F0A4C8|nr:ATP-binding cassette domain-containing protein [Pseudonocardia pini]